MPVPLLMKIYRAEEGIAAAAEALRKGEIICYPTETFYGLGIDVQNTSAREKLFSAKQRAQDKDLPLIASDLQMVATICEVKDQRLPILAKEFWPGPLTIILPSVDAKTSWAVRISSHPVARDIAGSFGAPIVSTSANLSGQPPVADPNMLPEEMRKHVTVLLDGGVCPGGMPSTIISLLENPAKIVREGAIPAEKILSLLYPS
jgi:L-threonylcarbamoyladenylate synthase